MTFHEFQTLVTDEQWFHFGVLVLAALMGTWVFALWRNVSLLERMAFRVAPFVLVICLFSIAFYSERFH